MAGGGGGQGVLAGNNFGLHQCFPFCEHDHAAGDFLLAFDVAEQRMECMIPLTR